MVAVNRIETSESADIRRRSQLVENENVFLPGSVGCVIRFINVS